MSAWSKVFLRNGLIWTAYMAAWAFAAGQFSEPGWPLGFSETANKVATFLIVVHVWVVMLGGAMCVFRLMIQSMTTKAAEQGKKAPAMRWRWFWSYFLEVDEEYRLRP